MISLVLALGLGVAVGARLRWWRSGYGMPLWRRYLAGKRRRRESWGSAHAAGRLYVLDDAGARRS